MKVTIAYQCDLEDIPRTVGELLSILKESDVGILTTQLHRAEQECHEKNVSVALTEIDQARRQLSKMDQKLLDYAAIIAGYAKTDADSKRGIPPSISEEEGGVVG